MASGITNAAYAPSACGWPLRRGAGRQLDPCGIPVFAISPGPVRTELNEGHFPEAALWTTPDYASRLVCALASGRFDALSGRYLHAEQDAPEQLEQRIDAILADDLNAVRLRR